MARFARIEKGIVREILVADKLPPFTPEITAQFRECSVGVREGWTFDGVNWEAPKPPPPATPEEIEATKEAQLNTPVIKALIEAIEDKFPMVRGQLRSMVKSRLK